MQDRFTHTTKLERGNISKKTRSEVYSRDEYRCVYCGMRFESAALTIDHLVPLALGGHDEITNYVTACFSCNNRKGHQTLSDFCSTLNIKIEHLPIYGDPIIDNQMLPENLREIRARIFSKYRSNEIQLVGKSAQKKIEKRFRTEFWGTVEGKKLEREFPTLTGPARIMIPEIVTIAKSARDFKLLVELAKSATTRNLITAELNKAPDLLEHITKLSEKSQDAALKKRLVQALARFRGAFTTS